MKSDWIRQVFLRKVPVFQWLPNYDGKTAIADLVAGITVGLTLIPQSIAYAALADLSPQYGLYASLTGGLVYLVFGTIPEISIAPTALLSLLTYNYTHDTSPALAVLLCFLSGCVELLSGILHLGFLVDFVSVPVVSGFTSAASIIIASSQVKNLLGLKFSAEGFIDVWTNIFRQIGETKKWDAILSLCCCIILIAMRQLKDIKTISKNSNDKNENKKLKTICWFISVSRNAIVVVCCAVTAYIFDMHNMKPFSLTEKVESGLPPVGLPPFEAYYNNQTNSFMEMSKQLGSGIIVVPLVAIIGNIAIAKAFSNGKTVDASQEMFTVGICNLVGSFFSSMPVNASFSRSAVNNASGVKTPFGGLYTGILVILALGFLTPYFSYIPKATLSSVIICAVIFMVELSIIKPMWKKSKINLIPFFTTFFACLFLGVELGILVGIAIDLLFMLYFSARPRIQVEAITIQNNDAPNYTTLKPEGSVLFPAVEHMRRAISKAGENNKVIVIDCIYVTRADYTVAQGIGDAISDVKKTGKEVVIMKANPQVQGILSSFCGDKCKFVNSEEELNEALKEKPAETIKTTEITKPEENNREKKEAPKKPKHLEINLNDNELDDFPSQFAWKIGKPRIDRRWTHAEIIIPSSSAINKAMTRL